MQLVLLFGKYLFIFVLSDKIVGAKLLIVFVVVPKMEVIAISLEVGHLVKDTQVSSIVVWTEAF